MESLIPNTPFVKQHDGARIRYYRAIILGNLAPLCEPKGSFGDFKRHYALRDVQYRVMERVYALNKMEKNAERKPESRAVLSIDPCIVETTVQSKETPFTINDILHQSTKEGRLLSQEKTAFISGDRYALVYREHWVVAEIKDTQFSPNEIRTASKVVGKPLAQEQLGRFPNRFALVYVERLP